MDEFGGFSNQLHVQEKSVSEQFAKKPLEYKPAEAKQPVEIVKEESSYKVEEKPLQPKEEVKTELEINEPKEPKVKVEEEKAEELEVSSTVHKNKDNGRKIKRISITDSLKALKDKKEKNEEENEPIIKTEFSQDILEQVWKDFVVGYQSKSPSFSSAIGKYKPVLADNFRIEYKVDNKIMANDILNQTSLLEFLKRELKNNQIILKPILPAVEEKKKAYFDTEKFEELAKDFPGIIKLKEQLDLDFGV